MRQIIFLMVLSALGCLELGAAATNTAATNRVLIIDSSSMSIPSAKITLMVGALQRTNGVFTGDYKVKVSPYFFKNEKGRIAMNVTDDSMTLINDGKVAKIIGTATTTGKGGKCRHIDATATPVDINKGKLKLWFMAGDQKMLFEPAYHFATSDEVAATAAKTHLVARLQRPFPLLHK